MERPPLLIDPRAGDVEDDASSPESRSMLAIAGSLLAEISLPKLALSWVAQIGLPGLLIGAAPLVASAWATTVSGRVKGIAELGSFLILALAAAAAWYGGRTAFRIVERSFWSLTAIAVQPGYALAREGLRHIAARLFGPAAGSAAQVRINRITAVGAGLVASGFALAFVLLAWPFTQWTGTIGQWVHPGALVLPALANAVVIVSAALAGGSLLWGLNDALMDQPQDLEAYDPPGAQKPWRVVHFSDIHIVGEEHGLRIESGRSGPSGNARLAEAFVRLEAIHAQEPLDLVLVTGDMTDAGRSAEWAIFLDLLAKHPALAERMLVIPGNHDLNIVDRANPARLELPTSPLKRLRQMRTLSAMAAVQGDRVRVLDATRKALGPTLSEAVAPQAEAITAFADKGGWRLMPQLGKLWADLFPMVLPPATEDGLGVILLNSNAETHFSFTNALGLVTQEDARGIAAVTAALPRARWLLALHHHLVEYPKPAPSLSERIGTALLNGTWFVRQLKPLGRRVVALHGHRHIDWVGRCGPLRIVSAPSPVMGGRDDKPTRFHILRLAPAADGGLDLLAPQTVELPGAPAPA
ncbi:MAG: metallophosphoesterase [Alsobacter sp.]